MALTCLMEVAERGAFAQAALARAFERLSLPPDERALATELTLGVLRHRTQLIAQLRALLRDPFANLPPVVQGALLLGAYQLLHLRMPAHSAVDQAVALVPRHLGPLVGVANAVLRRLSRQLAEAPDDQRGTVALGDCAAPEALAEAVNQPVFFVREMWQRLGRSEALALAAAQNARPPVGLRIQSKRTSRTKLAALLGAQGIASHNDPIVRTGLHVRGAGAVHLLPGYDEGLFSVQDLAATAVGILASPPPDALVLDICAAPGGKSTHLAELLGPEGHVVACDIHAKRLERLERGAARLGLSEQITPVEADGRSVGELRQALGQAHADLVLLDAPCSGLGTLRRHPELRMRTPEQQAPLLALQAELLAAAAQLVRPAGRLVYSVCTPLLAEGREQLERFLRTNRNFELEPLHALAPELKPLSEDGLVLESWPHRHGMDAFFAAALRRTR